MKAMHILKTIFIVLFLSTSVYAESPEHAAIEMAFFKCVKSKNLEGGIYGKGPFKKFGKNESSCKKNEWVKIPKSEFKLLASEWHNHNWSGDIVWWQND